MSLTFFLVVEQVSDLETDLIIKVVFDYFNKVNLELFYPCALEALKRLHR